MRTEGVAAVWFGALLLLAGSVVFPGAPLSALSLVALGVAAVLSVGQLVSRAYLPHEDDHLRWRRLLKAAPGLELERFGGTAPPRGRLRRGPAQVRLREVEGGLRITVRLADRPEPLALSFDGQRRGPPLASGDPRLDGLGVVGAPELALAALTAEVRDGLAAHVVDRPVRVQPSVATLVLPQGLRTPAEVLDRVDALAGLLQALDRALETPILDALHRTDDADTVVAARLRCLLGLVDDAAAVQLAETTRAPTGDWDLAEGWGRAQDPALRARGLRALRAGLATEDAAVQRHALSVLRRRYPRRIAEQAALALTFEASAQLLPEAIESLPGATLAEPRFLSRLDEAAPSEARALVPLLEDRGAEAALLRLAHRPASEVGQAALDALARSGTLGSVPGLIRLARTWRTPARRGAALLVARRLQARFGHPARGALSDPPVSREAGHLSPH